jgi:hypothetical protein
MKPLLSKNTALLGLWAGLFVMAAAQGSAGSEGVSNGSQPAFDAEGPGRPQVGDHRVPLRYDLRLLELGRSVYADLQEARQAALDKEATNLRVALQEARAAVHRLQLPPRLIALDAQLRVIRNDLKDESKQLDQGLWAPVEAETDQALVQTPKAEARVREAVRKARAAAGRGDREAVSAQLDVVESSLRHSLGMFRLKRVEQDLAAASAAASSPVPDWSAALEAVQSTLAVFHWYTQVPVHGLLSAYNAAVSAYALATGPQFRPDQRQRVLDYLAQAEKDLNDAPGGGPLAEEAHGLIDKVKPEASEIKLLLDGIQSQIELQRQRAEDRYWEAIARNPSE